MNRPAILSRDEPLVARKQDLPKAKELPRRRDHVSAQRREAPWVRVEKRYVFDGSDGKSPIERIQHAVEFYREGLAQHPVAQLCADGALSRKLLQEFARIQYVDSTLWVAMLSLAKGRVKHARLKRAITENILCESGHVGTPHTTLCQRFVESLGTTAEFGDYRVYAPMTAHSVEVMNVFDRGGDGIISGWLLAAESLVPTLFSVFRPAFAQVPGADLTYLDEHIHVDAEEHAQWMCEAAQEISTTEEGFRSVMSRVEIGGRVTWSGPDAIYARTLLEAGSNAVTAAA
jgi:pyrroloquinoline quinone (PQQ) biosynthesis protein C